MHINKTITIIAFLVFAIPTLSVAETIKGNACYRYSDRESISQHTFFHQTLDEFNVQLSVAHGDGSGEQKNRDRPRLGCEIFPRWTIPGLDDPCTGERHRPGNPGRTGAITS